MAKKGRKGECFRHQMLKPASAHRGCSESWRRIVRVPDTVFLH